MNLIDLVIVIPIGWGVYVGYSKGLVHELAQVAALGLGIFAGFYLSKWIGGFVASLLGTDEQQTQLIAFLVAFIGTLILVFFIAKGIEKGVKKISLGFVNRLLGSAFACIKYILILSVAINFINSADQEGAFLKQETRDNSLLYKPVGTVVPMIMPFVTQVMSEAENTQTNPEDDQDKE